MLKRFLLAVLGVTEKEEVNPTLVYLDWCDAEEEDEEYNLLYRG